MTDQPSPDLAVLGKRDRGKRRTAFEKAILKALPASAKGTGWRAKQNTIVKDCDGWFVCADVCAIPEPLEPDAVRLAFPVKLAAKPMAVDPIFWRIMDLEENIRKPLTFRAWAAFRCWEPTFKTASLENGNDQTPETVAHQLVEFARAEAPQLMPELSTGSFADRLAAWSDDVERDTDSVIRICALIAEERCDEARSLAEAVINGDQPGGMTYIDLDGRSFFELAVAAIGDGRF